MRALLQRVQQASVSVEDVLLGEIQGGWAILLGVAPTDTEDIADKLAERVANLRSFSDDEGRMNLSAYDVSAEMLVVSQFTLYAETARGRRPSFVRAAPPDLANPLVDRFSQRLRDLGFVVRTGQFGAHMVVTIVNDGPVTIMLDSDDR
jgi:D-tyrosyl-tRNA(Tyr) deacylase